MRDSHTATTQTPPPLRVDVPPGGSSLLIAGKTRKGCVSFVRLVPFLKLGVEFEAKVFELL
jgi:hypothetical protein